MIIYKAVNKINSKVYIGQTLFPLERRIELHSCARGKWPFPFALRKYGLENFDFEIIGYCDTKNKLNFLECFYIKFFNSKSPSGYNLTIGGEGVQGYKHTVEYRKKESESRIGEKNPNWGKTFSKEHCKKLNMAKIGRHRSKEACKNMSIAKTGEKNPNYGKKNPIFAAACRLRTGEKHPMFGKPGTKGFLGKQHTDETRNKISDAKTAWWKDWNNYKT